MRFLTLIAALAVSACTAVGVPSIAGAADTDTESESTLSPLSLGISIHVEGYDEVRDPAAYAPHLAQVQQVATEASEEGGVLTFELDRSFTTAALDNGETFIADLDELGQGVGVHADLGGTTIRDLVYVTRLTAHKADVEALLDEEGDTDDVVTTVSGVCSTGRWVENVLAAGMFAATGSVEWCLKSLDEIPTDQGYDIDAINACTRPQDCHGAAPTDWEHKLHPWPATSSTDWLTPSTDGTGLWLLAGEGGIAIHCLGEHARGDEIRDCGPDDGDVTEFARIVQSYVDAREPDRFNSLNLSWSIGAPAPEGFARSLVQSISGLVADGLVEWKTLGQLAADAADAALAATEAPATSSSGDHSVTNPASGAALHVEVTVPTTGDGSYPVVVMVPGGTADSTMFTSKHEPERLADLGYLTVVFDPDGRGESDGTEDNAGEIQQAGLAEVVRFATALPEADASLVALASNSFGVTMATGALVNHPDLGVDVLVDWEGPADRNDTGGCDGVHLGGHLYGVYACDSPEWDTREAVTYIAQITQHYVRLQSIDDHAQDDTDSAAAMVDAAVAGAAGDVYLNRMLIRRDVVTPIPTRMLLADRPYDRQLPELIDEALTRFGF